MLILTAKDLRELLPYPDCLRALEETLARPADVPPRQHAAAGDGQLLLMPAYQRDPAGLGVKLVGVFEKNAQRGLDRIQALYVYLDAASGRPLALMEGRALTAIRTAAVSALATRYLANAGPATLAVFGAGVQARAHIEAMPAVRTIERVLVCGSTPEKSRALAEEMGGEGATVEAALAASIICTCTTSAQPLWDGSRLREGTHINAVGNHRPLGRELDETSVLRARVVVDTRAGAWSEAGDLLLPLQAGAITHDHVLAELPDLIRDEPRIRRTQADITLFKSVGHALQDLALARLAFQRACSLPPRRFSETPQM